MTSVASAQNTTTAASAAKSQPRTARAKISGDYEMFLKMLTTQMQNQDPLNPIESSDYAVQLATFSGVEQQVKTNELLEALSTRLGASGIGGLANWVGMEARAPVKGYHDGSGLTLAIQPRKGADKTVLAITDAKGSVLQKVEVAPMEGNLKWPVQVGDGRDWPAGQYGFRLESWDGDKELGTDDVPIYAKVVEARQTSGGTVLVVEGGGTVKADDVSALRLPTGAS